MGNEKKKKSSKKEDETSGNSDNVPEGSSETEADTKTTRSGKVRLPYDRSKHSKSISAKEKVVDTSKQIQSDKNSSISEDSNNNARPGDDSNPDKEKSQSDPKLVSRPTGSTGSKGNSNGEKLNNSKIPLVGDSQELQTSATDGVQVNVNADEDDFEEDSSSESSSGSESSSDYASSESSSEDERKRKRKRKKKGDKLKKWKRDPDFLELVEKLVDKKSKKKRKKKTKGKSKAKIASNSNTTIYAPALNEIPATNTTEGRSNGSVKRTPEGIATGIRQIRLQQQFDSPSGCSQDSDSDEPDRRRKKTDDLPDEEQSEADRAVLAAEKFKAAIAPPVKGMAPGTYFKDDLDIEFMHVACHIDANTRAKIQRGEFVDLERLLPKANPLKFHRESDEEKRMQMVSRDGMPYWVPAEKENKIDCFKKWEQAFRVYASIYCQANPL